MKFTGHGPGQIPLESVHENEALEVFETTLAEVDEHVEKEKLSRSPAVEVQSLPWQFKEAQEHQRVSQPPSLREIQHSAIRLVTPKKQKDCWRQITHLKKTRRKRKTRERFSKVMLPCKEPRRSVSSRIGETVPIAREKEASSKLLCLTSWENLCANARRNFVVKDVQFRVHGNYK